MSKNGVLTIEVLKLDEFDTLKMGKIGTRGKLAPTATALNQSVKCAHHGRTLIDFHLNFIRIQSSL